MGIANGTAGRSAPPLRPSLLIGVAVTLLGVMASLLYGDVPIWGALHGGPAVGIARILPFAAAICGLLTACLGLLAAPTPPPPSDEVERLSAALARATQEMGTLLSQERWEAANLHEACQATTQETTRLTTRLSNLVRDAEERLREGIGEVEQQLRSPLETLARNAESAAQLERLAPEFDLLLRSAQEQQAARTQAASADQLTLAQFATLAATVTDKLAALDSTSATLSRDATALDQAGREIAAAGANAVMRAAEAVTQVEAAMARLPEAATLLANAATAAGQTLAEASAVLCGDAASIDAALRETTQTADMLQQQSEALRASGLVAAEQISEAVDAAIAAATGVGNALVDVLQKGGADIESLAETTVTRIAAAGTGVCETISRELATTTAALAAAGGDLRDTGTTAALEIGKAAGAIAAISAAMAQTSGQLAEHSAGLVETSTQTLAGVRRIEEVFGDLPALTSALSGSADAIRVATQGLDETATRTCSAVAQTTQSTQSVLADLPAVTAAVEGAAGALRQEAEAIARAKQGLSTVADRAVTLLATEVQNAESARQDTHAATDLLQQATASLHRESGCLAEAATRIIADTGAALAQINQNATEAIGQVAAATTTLRADSALLSAAGQDIASRAAEACDGLRTAAGQAVARLAGETATHAGMNDKAIETIEQIAAVAATFRTDGALLAAVGRDVAAQAANAGAMLRATSEQAAERLAAEGAILADHVRRVADQARGSAGTLERLGIELADKGDAALARLHSVGEQALLSAAQQHERALAGLVEPLAAATEANKSVAQLAQLQRDDLQRLGERAGLLGIQAEQQAAQLAPLLDRLDGAATSLERQGLHAASTASHHLDAVAAAITRTDAAQLRVFEAAAQVQLAAAEVAKTLHAPTTPLDATLRRVARVTQETEELLRDTEQLAQATLAAAEGGLAADQAACTPDLLAGLAKTIDRLRTVATSLALASDFAQAPRAAG